MAKKVSTNFKIMGKLSDKGRKAVLKHAGDETEFDTGGDIPENVRGIAQLTSCYFSTYKEGPNKGKPFFRASGTVKTPHEHEGLITSVMEPMHDTPGRSRETEDDHVKLVLNIFRRLGLETTEYGGDLDAMAEALKEEAPHFRFRTWKGDATPQFKNPRVQHVWQKAVEYVDEETNGAVVDETEDEEVEEVEEEETEEAGEELSKLQSLAADADNDDDVSAKKILTKKAAEADLDPEEYGTWADLATALEEGEAEEEEAEETDEAEEEAEEEEEEVTPVKKDVFKYKPKGSKKRVDVEVINVYKAKRTVDVKNLDDNTTIKGVSWDALISE